MKQEQSKDSSEDMEMLSQPLLTEEGFLNEACMNELTALIKGMPKDYERLSSDPEWSGKVNQWAFRKDIVGALAKWACRQSPYNCPDNLEVVCKYLDTCLKKTFGWDKHNMLELSLVEINKACWDILGDFKPFLEWNEPKKGPTSDISFISAHDGPRDPDYDFIDLDALLYNVCLDIRDERRVSEEFNKKFEKESNGNRTF